MTGRSRNALKRAHSKKVSLLRMGKFSLIVRQQKGLCWYCNEEMGGNCNREHLLSKARGGTDHYPPGNIKATHQECNTAAGHLSVKLKMKLREVGHAQGREEMIRLAYQLRRAETRLGFMEGDEQRPVKRQSKNYWRRLGLEGKPSWWDG